MDAQKQQFHQPQQVQEQVQVRPSPMDTRVYLIGTIEPLANAPLSTRPASATMWSVSAWSTRSGTRACW